MAGMTDPRAAAFNSAVFRDAIRFAMTMGLPNSTSERITFTWKVDRTYDNPDPAGKPYFFNQEPTQRVIKDPVQIPAAVQFQTDSPDGTPFGSIENPHIIVTLLDEDWALVSDADEIVLDDDVYVIKFTAPPMGLFDATVYQMYATAKDESSS